MNESMKLEAREAARPRSLASRMRQAPDLRGGVLITMVALISCGSPRPIAAPERPLPFLASALPASVVAPPAASAIPAPSAPDYKLAPETWRAAGMLGDCVMLDIAPGLVIKSLDRLAELETNPSLDHGWKETAREKLLLDGQDIWLVTLEDPDTAVMVVLRREQQSYVIVTALGIYQGGLGITIETVDRGFVEPSKKTALVLLRVVRLNRGYFPDLDKPEYVKPEPEIDWIVVGLHADRGFLALAETSGYETVHIRGTAASGAKVWLDARCHLRRGWGQERMSYNPARERFAPPPPNGLCKARSGNRSQLDP